MNEHDPSTERKRVSSFRRVQYPSHPDTIRLLASLYTWPPVKKEDKEKKDE